MQVRVEATEVFSSWLGGLKNSSAKRRIVSRIDRIAYHGALMGDCKAIGGGLVEMRFDTGPGYRVYVSLENGTLLLLLVGGDKSSQVADIAKARKLLKEWRTRDA
ncbi:type II toxin-antitoxin system RelE/ParE family toxin [Eggerthella sp. NSJ-70]|uniref:Type II toxin-antitoxin system RelE/ParE family toxin n=1 Tax=Eggerthella hominis TaxID=2763043 RepID=A0ABR7BQ09_9ACTN|nr:type II toxin-antitoxin system RelE/ParE family toxin [Eggerthella hominis]